MERGDSKVPLGVASPPVICACFEIKRPNMPGVRASVFYSTFLHSAHGINWQILSLAVAVLVSAYHGGIADQTRIFYAIVGIAPSADFWMGRPFLSPATKNGAFGLLGHVGKWIATVSYSIGIVGAARLWWVADPKV